MNERNLARNLGNWAILLTMGISWGSTFSLARIATVGGVHPLSLTFYEAAIAGAILLAVSGIRRRRILVTWSLVPFYLACGLLGMVLPAGIFFYAAAHVPAGILSIALAFVPIITFLASVLLRLERFALWRSAGVVLGMLAIVLLVGPQQADPAQLPWVLLGLLAAGCYAVFNVMLAVWKPRGATPELVTTGMFVAAALLLIPVLCVAGASTSFGWPWTKIEWAVLGLGIINAVSYTLFIRLVECAGPVFTSQTANLITLFGVLWGMVIFGEQHSLWVWLSLATMMLALSLVAPRSSAQVQRKASVR